MRPEVRALSVSGDSLQDACDRSTRSAPAESSDSRWLEPRPPGPVAVASPGTRGPAAPRSGGQGRPALRARGVRLSRAPGARPVRRARGPGRRHTLK